MPTLLEKIKSAVAGRVSDFDVSKIIQGHREATRDRKYLMFGNLHAIRFDISSEAQYEKFHEQTDDERVRMRNRMLFFDWSNETAPKLGQYRTKNEGIQFVFPVGIPNPPRQAVGGINQLVDAAHPPVYVEQDLLDGADGYIEDNQGRDSFAVIHPIIAFVIYAQGAFITYLGHPDLEGRRPSLLWNPITKEAHFVGGQLLPEKST